MARILIIDDEEMIQTTLCQALKLGGHTTLSASNGNSGIALFRDNPIDLVLTDILMPEKEGIETIMELRRINPDVTIIAMSGGGRVDGISFLDAARQLGANAALKKPFEIQDLYDTVDECLAS